MATNADFILAKHLADDPRAAAEWKQNFKLKRDPRITPFGELLGKSSLDELLQLWNVIKGDMSLVGPRPIAMAEIGKYGRRFANYVTARPGLTGQWQVSGRSELSYRRRVAIDCKYLERWSLSRDLLILLQTVQVVALRQGSC